MATRLIGIDPGLRCTGWGIVEVDGSRLVHVGHGTVKPPTDADMAARLMAIYDGVCHIVSEHAPGESAVEMTFVNRDANASLKLGQARGAAILALARSGLACAEYAPNLVKKSVVGRGHADKAQIKMMVQTLLNVRSITSADAADALAVAITHAHHRTVRTLEGVR